MRSVLFLGAALAAYVAASIPASADVVVGTIGPITGSLAVYGEQVKSGAQAAIDAINAQGGILGQKAVLKVYDDGGDPKQGVSAANQVIADDVHFIIGPVLSGIAMPTSEILAEGNVMIITPTATIPALTDRGLWNVFRTCGRDDQQAGVAASYIVKNFKGRRIAIVHDKGAYGQGLAEGVKDALNREGVQEVMFQAINAGEKDFSALISRMKEANVEFIYYGGYHAEAGLIIRQEGEAGLHAPLMGGDGLSSSEFWTIAGPAAEGTLMTNSPDPAKKPAAKEVVEQLAKDKIAPEAYTLNSYAAVQLIKAGAELAKTLDPQEVAKVLKTGKAFDTVVGTIAYTQAGDLTKPNFVVYEWKDGRANEKE